MLAQTGVQVTFYGQFTTSGGGATGLTVTIDVYEVATDGTTTQVVTGGSATHIADGFYRYTMAAVTNDTTGEYLGVFKTSGTADLNRVGALWVVGRSVESNVKSISDDTTAANNAEAFFDGTGYAGTNNVIPTVTTVTTVTTVNGLAANSVTASALATDAVAEIQSGLSTLDAAGVRAAVGLASANLDTQLTAIDDLIDTEVAAIYSRIGAPAGASIAADIAAVKAETASILDDTGTAGVVVASGSKTGYSLAAAGLDSIVIETGVNARQAVSAIAAACAGVASGLATTTAVYRAAANSGTTRITATVDADGNRSAVTLNLPA